MTEQNLSDLLERSAERTHVGPPPLEEMLARTRHVRRRRTLLATIVATGAVVTVVVGAAVTLGPGDDPQVAGAAGTSVSPSPTQNSTVPPDQSSHEAPSSLAGVWQVRALLGRDGQSLLTAAYANDVLISFHKGEVTGTTGCNTVFGRYQQSGTRGRDVVFPHAPLGSTTVHCQGEPPLVARLLDVRHVTGTGSVRYLRAANGQIIAKLRATGLPPGATPYQPGDSEKAQQKILANSTPLSDCPEARKFLEQPEVKHFYKQHFNYAPDDDLLFQGGCPSLATVKKGYAQAQQRVRQGLVK